MFASPKKLFGLALGALLVLLSACVIMSPVRNVGLALTGAEEVPPVATDARHKAFAAPVEHYLLLRGAEPDPKRLEVGFLHRPFEQGVRVVPALDVGADGTAPHSHQMIIPAAGNAGVGGQPWEQNSAGRAAVDLDAAWGSAKCTRGKRS